MQKLTPCLWFNFNADEAVERYLAILKNGEVLDVTHYGDAVPSLKCKVLTMRFVVAALQAASRKSGHVTYELGQSTGTLHRYLTARRQSRARADWTAITHDHYWCSLCAGRRQGRALRRRPARRIIEARARPPVRPALPPNAG